MFTHYGCLTNRWFPALSHGALTAKDHEPTTLKHLAPYANKLLMPRGIRAMNEWSFTQDYGQETSPHVQAMGSLFTCCHYTGGPAWSSARKNRIREDVPPHGDQARPWGGRSLDHVCAEQLRPGGVPLLLAVGRVQSGEYSNFSYRTAGTSESRAEMFLGTASSLQVYEQLVQVEGTGQALFSVVRRQHTLQLVRDDLVRIQAHNLSASDRQKLEAWASLLSETESQCAVTASALDVTAQPPTCPVRPRRCSTLRRYPRSACPTQSSSSSSLRILTTTFCPVYLVMPTACLIAIGSAILGGTCVERVNEQFAAIDEWHAQQFASLVGELDSITEGDGKLLDNCATVWFQEFSDGASQNLNNFPIIQAGSCGGYFKTGVAVNVEDGSPDLSPGNSESLCAIDGTEFTPEELELAGTPPNLANAPINKYFCSLMNALQVTAGEDGFPALGGSAPVTHFGYYDNTKDFASFLQQEPVPPTIKDPGEFEALRASA